jgi:hypothetical protein
MFFEYYAKTGNSSLKIKCSEKLLFSYISSFKFNSKYSSSYIIIYCYFMLLIINSKIVF